MTDDGNVLTRRDFVRGSVGAAVIASVFRGALESEAAPAIKSWVAVVRDQAALNPANRVNETVLRQMLTEALKAVTGKADPASAWRVLVRKDDIVGLVHTDHLNQTHPELVDLVKTTLNESGIAEENLWMVQGSPRKVEKCNALISLPALKAHWLTGIGTVFKNYITFTGSPSSYLDFVCHCYNPSGEKLIHPYHPSSPVCALEENKGNRPSSIRKSDPRELRLGPSWTKLDQISMNIELMQSLCN